MINVDYDLLPEDAMFPLPESMHDGMHIFIIGGVLLICIRKCLTMIGHKVLVLGEDYTNSIIKGICLNFKWLLQV